MSAGLLSRLRPALIPVLVGVAARLLLVAWTSPIELSLDEARFWDLAGSRMSGTAFLPPLYPFVLAGLRAIAGGDLATVRVLQCLGSSVSILLVFVLGERHLGPGRGRGPAWIVALLPALIHYDGRLKSEALVVFLLCSFAVLWTSPDGGRWVREGIVRLPGVNGLYSHVELGNDGSIRAHDRLGFEAAPELQEMAPLVALAGLGRPAPANACSCVDEASVRTRAPAIGSKSFALHLHTCRSRLTSPPPLPVVKRRKSRFGLIATR